MVSLETFIQLSIHNFFFVFRQVATTKSQLSDYKAQQSSETKLWLFAHSLCLRVCLELEKLSKLFW